MVQAYFAAFRSIGNRIEQIGNSVNMVLFNGPGVLCRVPIDRKSIGNRIEHIGSSGNMILFNGPGVPGRVPIDRKSDRTNRKLRKYDTF